jgi:hypothetical protein
VLALQIGLAAMLMTFGGYWDASEHVVTGIVPGGEDFLWPPHLMIYGAFLLALLVAVEGLLALALPNWKQGVRDPRRWVRRSPYVAATALAAGYGLLSVPGDAIWHLLFGIDLTAWSPPHIFIALATAAMPICAIGLLLQYRDPATPSSHWHSLAVLFLLALALNIAFLIGTLEWEFGEITRLVAARPIWLYPALTGGIAFFVLALARRLVPGPWTATTLALLYFATRLAATSTVHALTGSSPRLTLVFLGGAVLLDLAAQRGQMDGWQQRLAEAGAFTVGFSLVALSTIAFYPQFLRLPFGYMDYLMAVVATLVLCAGLHGAAGRVGRWLLGHQVAPQVAASPVQLAARPLGQG